MPRPNHGPAQRATANSQVAKSSKALRARIDLNDSSDLAVGSSPLDGPLKRTSPEEQGFLYGWPSWTHIELIVSRRRSRFGHFLSRSRACGRSRESSSSLSQRDSYAPGALRWSSEPVYRAWSRVPLSQPGLPLKHPRLRHLGAARSPNACSGREPGIELQRKFQQGIG